MAKTVIGIDLGFHTAKAVCLTGSAKSPQLLNAAMVPQTAATQSFQQTTEKAMAALLKDLITRLKSGRGECHFAINSPAAVLKYIDTPFFPQSDMRASLKLNHQTYLRQSFENFTFDGVCLFSDPDAGKKEKKDKKTDVDRPLKKGKALIAGLPSSEVLICYMAAKRLGLQPQTLSLAPLVLINAFETAYVQVFQQQSILLLDIGHLSSNLTIVHHGEIFLTRTVNLGGKNVTDYLTQSQGSLQAAEAAEAEGGEALAEAIQGSLAPMMREVHSSVNFFERNTETDLNGIYLSGRLARAPMTSTIVQKEVGFACEVWNPAQGIKVSLPSGQKEMYAENHAAFAVSIGAARSALG